MASSSFTGDPRITTTRDPGDVPATRTAGDVPASRRATESQHLVRRDLIRWGPIAAGIAVVLATTAVLTSLGLAIGLSAIEPAGAAFGDISTGAWIWGIASAAVAFFAGGLVAGATSAVGGRGNGALNGFMVGAAAIAATVAFVGLGLSNALGAAATALGQVVQVGDLAAGADDAADAFARAEGGAWGTFIGLTIALLLAAAGGAVAARGEARDAPDRR